jgi:uncharacterized protein YjdB
MRKVYLFLNFLALSLLFSISSNAQVSLTATIGTLAGSYTNLWSTFNAINAGTHRGVITITITASTAEPAACVLNRSGTGAASYTSVDIKPGAAATPTVSGTVAAAALIKILGDFVTIDGSNTVGGTTRDLTIQNNSGTTPSVLWIADGGATAIHDFTIKNAILINGVNTSSALIAGNGTTLGNAGLFNTITIQNNSIQRAWIGMFLRATPSLGNGNNVNVIGNNLNTAGANAINLCAIYLEGIDGTGGTVSNNTVGNYSTANIAQKTGIWLATSTTNATVTGNTISGIAHPGGGGFSLGISNSSGVAASNNVINGNTISALTNAGTGTTVGIFVFAASGGVTVRKNKITDIKHTNIAGYACYGVNLASTSFPANVNVYNNFIADVAGYGDNFTIADNGFGIAAISGSGYNVFFNSINMTTNQTTGISGAMLVTGATTLDVRNNIFANNQTAGTRYGIYSSAAAAAFTTIDYNNYYSASTNLGWIGGVARTTIAQMQAGFGGNVNSLALNPLYTSGTDLHLTGAGTPSPGLQAGTPITTPAITDDIDAAPRSSTVPTIGADELDNTITYIPLANTCADTNITLTPVSIITSAGIPLAGVFVPRVYFRKGLGPWNSQAGTYVSGPATNSVWKFVISSTLMGGVTGGDVISYYVIAQTSGGGVFSYPSTGLVATDVNTVATPPTTPFTYTVNAVSLTGLSTTQSVCYNAGAATSASYPYTGTGGTPNQYTLTWSPAGPTAVPAYVALPGSPITVSVPAATALGTYIGTITIRNATSLCTATYTVTLNVVTLTTPIVGNLDICLGATSGLSNATTGGTWSSSNTTVATVGSSTGVVFGAGAGTSNITYTSPTGCTGIAVVTVSTPPTAISGPGVVCQNAQIVLTNGTPGGSWSSTVPAVGSIGAASGIVDGISPGTTTISYTMGGCVPATKVITVNPIPAAITGPSQVCQGFQITLATTSTGGAWSSSASGTASVTTGGVVTGVAPGTATISYTFPSGCFVVQVVTVNANPSAITGDTVVCLNLPTITLSNATPGGTWSSNNSSIASVGAGTGVVTGVATGMTIITYLVTATGCYDTSLIRVNRPPAIITGDSVVCEGKTITLLDSVSGGIWSSGFTTVATIGSASGILTGVLAGTATISYTTKACVAATRVITVNQSPSVIGGVTNVCAGSSTTLSNGVPGGTWASSSSSVLVSPTGVVTGLSVGAATTITYTLPNGCFTTAPILVAAPPAPIIGPDSVCQGASVIETDATPGGVWSTSNALIATAVAATGEVFGTSPGTVILSYTLVSGCAATKTFTVRTPLPASVSYIKIPDTAIVCAGTEIMFIAVPMNGGANPTFVWGNFVGPGYDTLGVGDTLFHAPTHGDYVNVRMFRDNICALPDPANYAEYVNVYPHVSPTVTIKTLSGSTLATYVGEVFTLFAEVTFGGITPSYQWYRNGSPIAGATSSSYSTPIYATSTFSCVVSGTPPCYGTTSGTSNMIIIKLSTVDVQTIAGVNSGLSLFPNPNTGDFTLTGGVSILPGNELNIEVTDVLGHVIYKGKTMPVNGLVQEKIALGTQIVPGTYIVRINGDNVNETFHFVVNK